MSGAETMQTYGLYLNGEWTEPRDPVDVLNPSTGEPFARMGTIDRDGVRQVLEDAQAAWPGWRGLTAMQRGDDLLAIADAIKRRSEAFARTITLENGKPINQSRGEVAMTIDHLRWFAEEGRRAYGRLVPHQKDGKRHMVLRVPVGVVGAIAPWNFPLVLSVRKAAPALAAGCPVVLKPATATPICAALLAEAVEEAGLPAGVFQIVAGKASQIAGEMLENPICRKISFTGSTEVGQELIRGSADQVKNLSLELGGHAPVLVFDDADLETAVHGALITKFRNTGQSCIAANRIYVQSGIYDKFMQTFEERAKNLKVGDGFEEGVEIGPLIDEATLNEALRHVEQATSDGARVVCGGKRWGGGAGYFLEPTVLADVPDDALCMKEETFAPIAPVARFEKEEEAIEKANQTRYGLAAYAFTNDLSRTWRLAERMEAGTLGINDAVPTSSNCPFGGFKQSGLGRELGSEGMDAFMETKHVSLGVQA
jgi:succinate-semialdehyde dehydrogenase/glutarate-semialdehyde dehydrogenase